jgi:hypothetical protein
MKEEVKISANGEEISTVTSNKFLEAVITNDSCTKNDINRTAWARQQWQI